MAEDLIVFIPNHGYSDDEIVWVSWLSGHYYIDDSDTDTFKLTDGPGGANVEYTSTITSGWVREIDASTGTITIDDLDHLEGERVTVTANGVNLGSYTVSSGSITLTDDVYTYQVGKLYAAKIKTMRFAVPGNGNIVSRIKKIGEQTVRYVRSQDIQVGQEHDGIEYMEDVDADYNDKSADKSRLNYGNYNGDGYSVVKSVEPFPMTVLGIIVEIEVTER